MFTATLGGNDKSRKEKQAHHYFQTNKTTINRTLRFYFSWAFINSGKKGTFDKITGDSPSTHHFIIHRYFFFFFINCNIYVVYNKQILFSSSKEACLL